MNIDTKLGEVTFITTGKLDANARDHHGKYPFFTCGEENLTINAAAFDTEAVLLAGNGNFSVKYYKGKFNAYQRTYVITPKLVDGKWLFYLVMHHVAKITAGARGSTIKYLRISDITDCAVKLVPLSHQKRIVAKIEELFSKLDNSIAALKTAREQLRVYRQAILKHAFEGKLTAKWREENADKLETSEQLLDRIQQERDARYQQQLEDWKTAVKEWETRGKKQKRPAKPKKTEQITSLLSSEIQKLYELPEGWIFLRLGNFIDKIDAGKSFKCDERPPIAGEVGVVKVSAVTWGEYNESESKTCLDAEKVNPAYFIKNGDFILSRANTIELVGNCIITKRVTKPIMLSDKTLRINFSSINQKYVLEYLRSHYGRTEIMDRSTGNQESMRNIGQDRIKSIVIPICGRAEMDVIEISLNEKFESISQLSKEIKIQLLKAENLRQSILKQAFSGQLVPQDPNDEPASKLLDRIKAEKKLLVTGRATKKQRPINRSRQANARS
ncbi:MAG TPA: restriction endonuclease subunit S [Gammaproteobacteria bacterium]|nr:restriction endonuclease subunit S [Gammaproteobacteria bacterium]